MAQGNPAAPPHPWQAGLCRSSCGRLSQNAALGMFVTLLEIRRKGGTTAGLWPTHHHLATPIPGRQPLSYSETLTRFRRDLQKAFWYFKIFTKCQIRLESNGHISDHSDPKVKFHSSSTFLFFSLSLSLPSIVVTFLACHLQYRKLWALKVYEDNFVFSLLSFYSYNKIS